MSIKCIESDDRHIYECFYDFDTCENVEENDDHLSEALYGAFSKGHITCAKMLVENGANITEVDDSCGDTFLHISCRGVDLDSVIFLSDKFSNIDIENTFGSTPLNCLCSEFGNERPSEKNNVLEIMELLVSKGANVNTTDEFGNTPLHNAIDSGYSSKKYIKFLLESGACVNKKNIDGNTPLHILCPGGLSYSPKKSINIAKILLEYGANIYEKNYGGETSLDRCNECELFELKNFLETYQDLP